MDFEVVVRYAVPGALVFAPVALRVLLGPAHPGVSQSIGILSATAVVPLGYLLHQVWLWYFEMRGGYITRQRENLDFLMDQYEEQIAVRTPEVDIAHAYYAWESWVYDDAAPKEHRNRARRLWQLHHGSATSAVASFFGLVVVVVTLRGALSVTGWVLLVFLYAFLLLIFAARAKATYRQVSKWELLMAIRAASFAPVEAAATSEGPSPGLLERMVNLAHIEQQTGRSLSDGKTHGRRRSGTGKEGV